MVAAPQAVPAAKPDLVLARLYDAPRDLVWLAWTRAEHVAQWWGPNGFTVTRCDWPARRGSALRIHIQGPDGKVWQMSGTFIEVASPTRLAFSGVPLDADGVAMFEAVTAVTFADQGGKTQLTVETWVTSTPPLTEENLAGMRRGWNENLEHLAALLPKLS